MAQVPVAEGVFTFPTAEPQLIGSRCGACGIVTFPAQDSCPRCASTEMAQHLLPRRGRLWAWTTQDFPPPAPPYLGPSGKDFVPFRTDDDGNEVVTFAFRPIGSVGPAGSDA